MKRLAILAALALTAATDPGPAPIPVHVGGRTVPADEGGWRFGWPGVYFEGRFRGTGVMVVVETGTEHMRLLIDGVEKAVLTKPGRVGLTFSDLEPGEHVVRLEKLTESQSGSAVFGGFYLYDGGPPLPVRPRKRAIEFIGDSHTVGYGNTSPVRECTREQVHDTTDTQQAFGPIVAKRLDADYRVIAYSGYGIVRNYDGGVPGDSLPKIYGRAIPGEEAAAADDGWQPQLIVINLGTNDFSTQLHSGEAWADQPALRKAWRERYVGFVRELAKARPQARFLLMAPESFRSEVDAVAATLNAGAAKPVGVVPLPALELTGCDWHPSLKDHRLMADLVASGIEKLRLYMD